MRPTKDMGLVRSILDREDITPGFFGDERATDSQLSSVDLIYFHQPGVGLFVANIKGNSLIFHAAIPKENRGRKAVAAAIALGKVLLKAGYTIYTVQANKLHQRLFVKAVGFVYLLTDNEGMRWYFLPKKVA